MKKHISIIIPLFNEEKNIPLVFAELEAVFKPLAGQYSYEVIFVNDGSLDHSQEVISKLSVENPHVKYLEFSKNFGKEIATSAGINAASGDAVMMLDADMQHPVNLIPQFLEKWQAGADVVVGIRQKNTKEGFVKKFGSKLFYFLTESISETRITPNATDFRLIDRIVVEEFNKFTEHGRITRGLIDWLGYERDYVYFVANERRFGVAAYNTIKLARLLIASLVSHSLVPLKLAGYLGVLIMILSFPLGVFIFIDKYVFDNMPFFFSGNAILAVIMLFLIGVVLTCLGIMALYIANIHIEVIGRPLYVVRRRKL